MKHAPALRTSSQPPPPAPFVPFLCADEECLAASVIHSTITTATDDEGELDLDFVTPRARPRPYYVCTREPNAAWKFAGSRLLVNRNAGQSDAGMTRGVGGWVEGGSALEMVALGCFLKVHTP